MKSTLLGIYRNILFLTVLFVSLMMLGCASGTTKTEGLTFDEATIKSVKESCTDTFKPATSGTIAGLWENKRAILKQARGCSQAANILAEQAENRNKVIGNE